MRSRSSSDMSILIELCGQARHLGADERQVAIEATQTARLSPNGVDLVEDGRRERVEGGVVARCTSKLWPHKKPNHQRSGSSGAGSWSHQQFRV
jgi:hypothetical protein